MISIRVLLALATGLPLLFNPAAAQPAHETAARPAPHARFHVDPAKGDDAASGLSAETPFRTLERARDAARRIARPLHGDVEIILAGGDYVLQRPFTLEAGDGGSDGFKIRYRAADGETPRLSGGKRIEGWSIHDRARGIYKAYAGGPIETRQLFVNGSRAVRARSLTGLPDAKVTATGYTLPAAAPIGTWKNPADIEFVYRHIWTNPRAGVEKITRQNDDLLVVMDQPGFKNGRNKGMTSIGSPWYVENAYELLDEPGEWYLDRTGAIGGPAYTFYYKPYDWENPANANIIAPVLEQLVVVKGESLEKPVQGLAFEGLTLLYTTWVRPSSPYGLPDAQNNVMRENYEKLGKVRGDQESIIDGAALRFLNARGIEILRSRFVNLGGIGICFATSGAQDILIEGNTFFNIAATGVQIGDYVGWETPGTDNDAFPSDPRLHVARNTIRNNYFNRCAVEYRSSVPLAITFPRDSVIAHNEIYNSPYSATHFGWSWDRIPKTSMGNNIIEKNRLQNALVELADGGLLYTLGASDPEHPYTIIRNNWARLTRWGQGFYFDESSSRYEVYDNVIDEIGDSNIKFNGNTNRETKVINLYSDKDRNIISKELKLEEAALSIEKVRPIKAPEHAAAVARIKAEAGLQPGFSSARMLPVDPVIYELEEHEITNGPYVTNGMSSKPAAFGYSGMGFLSNLANRAGSSVTIPVRVSRGGDYQMRFRYSAPNLDVTGLIVSVNGTEKALPTLPSTQKENAWGMVTQTIQLKTGVNSVAITSTGALKGAFLADRVDLVPVH